MSYLNDIQDAIQLASQDMLKINDYNYDWGSPNQKDFNKVDSFPMYNLYQECNSWLRRYMIKPTRYMLRLATPKHIHLLIISDYMYILYKQIRL